MLKKSCFYSSLIWHLTMTRAREGGEGDFGEGTAPQDRMRDKLTPSIVKGQVREMDSSSSGHSRGAALANIIVQGSFADELSVGFGSFFPLRSSLPREHRGCHLGVL